MAGDTIIGYVVIFRTKLSVKRQTDGVQTQNFPSNASFGIISGLEPSSSNYEFSVQAMLNLSGQPAVNPFVIYKSFSTLKIYTPG